MFSFKSRKTEKQNFLYFLFGGREGKGRQGFGLHTCLKFSRVSEARGGGGGGGGGGIIILMTHPSRVVIQFALLQVSG